MINRALKTIRQFHNLSISDVSDKTSLEPRIIKDLESDLIPASKDILTRYSKAFDLPVSALVFIAESSANRNSNNGIYDQLKLRATHKVLKIMEWAVERESKKKIEA